MSIEHIEEVNKNIDHIEHIEKFNPYHGKDGRFSTADASASFTYSPGKSKAHDNAIAREKERQVAMSTGGGKKVSVDEDANPDYRYHSTSFKNARSIQDDGVLMPSTHAQYGKGVYFAPNVEGTKGWTKEENEQVHLRVKYKTLKEKYEYDEFSDQGWTENKGVSTKHIEIKVGNQKWVNIDDADIRDDEVFEL